ncbi:hypothetical protein TREMEDRAFT_61407 [Tremella mesenterica DSM 1558]|uniref:uncharacterized protein n=1 Tax=Tremella mesenterica (strain ATCC 24925 / CBS 8224 / DSM 1558 / NBRC 9311 / NRRL Y-6157 / RJB 2259-6 / UBC 559-6) TaxID=578456 RepID=UPI0003F49009|nr:uncharacterized protein TREMEDRAFT_61407 [Tremella mesenterica DSM 1558]EIW70894.1 hypothetical protein TREMEDRAFT_61407 [Tremella mesenterica DSM 1558]
MIIPTSSSTPISINPTFTLLPRLNILSSYSTSTSSSTTTSTTVTFTTSTSTSSLPTSSISSTFSSLVSSNNPSSTPLPTQKGETYNVQDIPIIPDDNHVITTGTPEMYDVGYAAEASTTYVRFSYAP